MFAKFARSVSDFTATPMATAIAFILVLVWALSGPFFHYSEGWQLVINTGTTIVTFLMVFVLNNAQNRDTTAMNAKLDAIILAIDNADNQLLGLERQPELDSEAVRNSLNESIDEATRNLAKGAKPKEGRTSKRAK